MKRLLATAAFLILPVSAPAGNSEADKAFVAAREAFAKGNRAAVARATAELGTHPLAPWARYFQLSLQLRDLKNPSDAGVEEFVAREAGSWLGEKLRAEWLKWLVEQQDWPRAREQFARLERPDAEAVCHGLMARLQLGENDAAQQARTLLLSLRPLATSCLPPLSKLAASGELPADLVWQRLFRQWAAGRLKEAKILAGWLPASEAPTPRDLDEAAEHPARLFVHLLPRLEKGHSDLMAQRLTALATLRMAGADVRVAAARWQEIETRVHNDLAGHVWGRLALRAALSHLPEAWEWFSRAESLGASFDEEQQAWRIRAALRTGDWAAVLQASDRLSETLALRPEWLYWRARALAATGKAIEAQTLYRRIAGQDDFYGILASEALGEHPSLPPRAQPVSAEERQGAESHPLLVRALALIRAGLRSDGVREWNWALAGMNDRELLAAADFAKQQGVLDRAIASAERTREQHDFLLRYPTPYFDLVAPHCDELALDPAWVYGLMRQESRFVLDAHSSAGARGLMQLMPATAKWVARKIGLVGYHPTKVTEMNTNVLLGTNYLRMVMDHLAGDMVLATAAYNAGPARAHKWRAERPLEGAIYVESIPFNETRDYVKKVMVNAIHYAAAMGLPLPRLSQRLGVISPRNVQEVNREALP